MLTALYRLCWKEWRQSWYLLLAALLLPPLALRLSLTLTPDQLHNWEPLKLTMVLFTMGLIARSALVVFPAGTRQTYAEVHLPISPMLHQFLLFVGQALIATCAGMSFGGWAAQQTGAPPAAEMMLVGVVHFLAILFVTLAVARAVFPTAGLVVGMLWAFIGTNSSFYYLSFFAPSVVGEGRPADPLSGVYYWYLPVCLTAALLAYSFHLGHKLSLPRRGIAMGGLAVVLVGALFPKMLLNTFEHQNKYEWYFQSLTADDGSVVVEAGGVIPAVKPPYTLEMTDLRAGHSVTYSWNEPVVGVGMPTRTAVILLGQPTDAHYLHLYRWEMAGNVVRLLGDIPASPNIIRNLWQSSCTDSTCDHHSHGRYTFLHLPSLGHSREEIFDWWLIDSVTPRIQLIKPETYMSQSHITWLPDRIVLTGYNPKVIHLPDGAVSDWALPGEKGGAK